MILEKEQRLLWTYYHYKDKIEAELSKSILFLGEKNKLRDACEYALTNGGKRLRAALVMMVADAIGNDLDVTCVAVGAEYFHTSSLIADDLPCMDDDNERRNKPSTHKVFGEAVALLASYALLTKGFEKIHENYEIMKASGFPYKQEPSVICAEILKLISQNAGISGATGGQFMDLFPANRSLDSVKELIYKKTVTLFECSFISGWLSGGGDMDRLPLVKKASYHLGMAFQVADDLGDMEQDKKNACLTNVALLIGKERALDLYQGEIASYLATIKELRIDSSAMLSVVDLLNRLLKT